MAGLAPTPFSLGTVAVSGVTRALVTRMSPGRVLPLASTVLLAAMAMFATARGSLWEIAVVMAVAGLGVGVGAIFVVNERRRSARMA